MNGIISVPGFTNFSDLRILRATPGASISALSTVTCTTSPTGAT